MRSSHEQPLTCEQDVYAHTTPNLALKKMNTVSLLVIVNYTIMGNRSSFGLKIGSKCANLAPKSRQFLLLYDKMATFRSYVSLDFRQLS